MFPGEAGADEARARGYSDDEGFFDPSNWRAVTEVQTEDDKESEYDVIMNTEGEDVFKPQRIKMEDAIEDEFCDHSSDSEQNEGSKGQSASKSFSTGKNTSI